MPKHPGHVDQSGKTGRTRMGGNSDIKLPVNISTSNPSKLNVANPSPGAIPTHTVTKLAGKFHTRKG